MFLNNNDKKYIIKRVIVFLIISFISYFVFSGCVKAATYTSGFTYTSLNLLNNSYDGTTFNGGLFATGSGQGELIFSAVVQGGGQVLKQAYINVGTSSSNTVPLQCEISSSSGYTDSQVNIYVYTVKCPASLGQGVGIYSAAFQGVQGHGGLLVLSDNATFVTSPDSSSGIIAAQQSAAAQSIAEIQAQGQYDRVNADANATRIINQINSSSSVAHQDSQAIQSSITSTDNDVESSNCGIICKLKYIVSFLTPSNLIHLIVPTNQDWENFITSAMNTLTTKLGVIGLLASYIVSVLSTLIGTFIPNYCVSWNNIYVPNFETYTPIIASGQWCIDTYFHDGVLKTFHDTCYMFIGGLIVFAFLSYIHKAYKRLLDIPITHDDEYEYITESSWESAHIDMSGDNDYHDFGVSNRRTYRRKV